MRRPVPLLDRTSSPISVGAAPRPFSEKQLNSRKGGLKGGKARMEKLTAPERSSLSAQGVAARKKAPAGEWEKLVRNSDRR